MERKIPSSINGVILTNGTELSYGQIPTPQINEREVLIKVHSGVINPSDVMFVQGLYPAKKSNPTIAGFEGSGLVIAGGTNSTAQALIGHKVSFICFNNDNQGSWGEYIITTIENVVPIPGDLTYEEGATCLINPLTVQAFIHICKENGYKCIAHTAAASALGKMLLIACKQEGITLINIVRRQEQVDVLASIGAQVIINTDIPDWRDVAKSIFKEHRPKALFDAVSGETSSEIIALMPRNTTTYVYGALSLSNIELSPSTIIFQGKNIRGFWLTDFLKTSKDPMSIFGAALGNLASKDFKVTIAAKFTHAQYNEALEFYRINSTKGKVLIQNPNF